MWTYRSAREGLPERADVAENRFGTGLATVEMRGGKKVPPRMEDLRGSCVVPELRMLFENEYYSNPVGCMFHVKHSYECSNNRT